MGNPPPPFIRAMPERKRFFFHWSLPLAKKFEVVFCGFPKLPIGSGPGWDCCSNAVALLCTPLRYWPSCLWGLASIYNWSFNQETNSKKMQREDLFMFWSDWPSLFPGCDVIIRYRYLSMDIFGLGKSIERPIPRHNSKEALIIF